MSKAGESKNIGLGDLIKQTTSVVGIKPCGGCARRAAALNRWSVLPRHGRHALRRPDTAMLLRGVVFNSLMALLVLPLKGRTWKTRQVVKGALLASLLNWVLQWLIHWLQGDQQAKARPELPGKSYLECMPVSSKVYRRPDPLIYDQPYLRQQGLAWTWHNPDIQLYRNGVPVPSTEVESNTDYEIVARIWNGSTSAPAIQMPVRFSYFSQGACFVTELFGERPSPIGEMIVDLPVNGAPGHPAIARLPWRTPAKSGLYPLKVELIWSDDANPNNNVGYHGLIVEHLNSLHAHFMFPVRNNGAQARTLHFEADTYTIPPRPRYDPDERAPTPELTAAEVAAHQKEAATIHDRRKFPVPSGWRVEIAPAEVELDSEKDQQITVDVTAPDGFRGQQHINIHAFDEKHNLVGGMSLAVEG